MKEAGMEASHRFGYEEQISGATVIEQIRSHADESRPAINQDLIAQCSAAVIER